MSQELVTTGVAVRCFVIQFDDARLSDLRR